MVAPSPAAHTCPQGQAAAAAEAGSARCTCAPHLKFTLDLGYEAGPFSIRTTTTYLGKSAVDDQFLAATFTPAGRVPAGSVTVPGKTYLDLQLGYRLTRQAQLYFGMDNALGTQAPVIPTGVSGNVTGAETDAGTYDAIGRRYYVGVRASF